MKLKTYHLFILVIVSCFMGSCSDAEIVSGVYKGKIYRTDTMNATASVVRINDSFVRIDVKAEGESSGYIEYAQLTKNSDEAYNLQMTDDMNISLSGYYYENWLHINAMASNFVFEGQSP